MINSSTPKRFIVKYGSLLLITIFIFNYWATITQAQEPFPNCRLGTGGVETPYVGDYNISQLNMGRYLDWRTDADPASSIGLPAGVEYIQSVSVHQDKVGDWDSPYVVPPTYTVSPNLTTLASRAAANPGSLWRIGNEIERRDWNGGRQGEISPELYAVAFHEVREVIKAADPTARIGIGSVIEATPLRLAYLDKVWDSYYTNYGYAMGQDIDVWIVHGFLLREVRNSWGAEIPAGLDNTDADPGNNYDPAAGFLYNATYPEILAAHRNIAHFQAFTTALREWMAAHGERNKPLINTEYGILYEYIGNYSITNAQVNTYMLESFDYLFNATDAAIGYPADENRLVQSWFWYSLNDKNWNGILFDPTTKALTEFGTTWKNYVSNPAKPLASQPLVNLRASNLRVEPDPAHVLPGETITLTLKADISNSGNTTTATGNTIEVRFWDGVPNAPGSNLIGSSQIIDDLPGCGRFTPVETTWPNRAAGDHVWYVQVVPISGETSPNDNIAGDTASVFDQLPQADLQVSKIVNRPAPLTRSNIDYTIVVTNVGPDGITGVQVTDFLPNGISFVSKSSTQGVYYTAGIWEVGALPPASSATLTISARVDAQEGQTVTNSAIVTSSNPFFDPDPNNSGSAVIVPITGYHTYFPIILK